MRRLALAVLVVALAVPATAQAARTATAGIGEFFYTPDRVRIEPGDSVTWANRGEAAHTVTTRRDAPERFDSDVIVAGSGRFTRTFTRPGQYGYVCVLHPGQMAGVVQVGRDTVRPTVSGLRGRAGKGGLRVTLRLSEPSRVSVRVYRGGRLVHTLTKRRSQVGPESLVTKRRFQAGRYRLVVGVKDLEGNRSKTGRASFRVR